MSFSFMPLLEGDTHRVRKREIEIVDIKCQPFKVLCESKQASKQEQENKPWRQINEEQKKGQNKNGTKRSKVL